MLIYLIGNNDNARILGKNLCDGSKLFLAVDSSCRVAWRAKQNDLGLIGDETLKLLGCDFEVLILSAEERYVDTFCKLYHLEITNPGWSRDDDFIALINDGKDDVADLLLCTVAYYDLCWSKVNTILFLELLADGLAQREIAWYCCVEREIIVNSFLGCLLYVIRSVEIRFSHREVDDVESLSLEFLALLRHCQCCRWRECQKAS